MIAKFARLEFELFTKPSKSDFLRVCHYLYNLNYAGSAPTSENIEYTNLYQVVMQNKHPAGGTRAVQWTGYPDILSVRKRVDPSRLIKKRIVSPFLY